VPPGPPRWGDVVRATSSLGKKTSQTTRGAPRISKRQRRTGYDRASSPWRPRSKSGCPRPTVANSRGPDVRSTSPENNVSPSDRPPRSSTGSQTRQERRQKLRAITTRSSSRVRATWRTVMTSPGAIPARGASSGAAVSSPKRSGVTANARPDAINRSVREPASTKQAKVSGCSDGGKRFQDSGRSSTQIF